MQLLKAMYCERLFTDIGKYSQGEDPYLYIFQHIITLFIRILAEQTIEYPTIEVVSTIIHAAMYT